MNAWANYDDAYDQLVKGGLQITGDLDVSGRTVRVKVEDLTQKGWYALHEIRIDDGRFAIIGAYGWWVGSEKFQFNIELRLDGKSPDLSADQRAAIKARLAEDRKRAEAHRTAQAKRAADEATKAWGKYATSGECDYLDDKRVQAHGVKFTAGNSLVIPMTDTAGRVHGLQLIYPKGHPKRAKTGRNKDFWPAGLAKAGHFHQIGVIRDLVIIAEGYATAATLYEATGIPAIVAFDAGNLQPVAVAIRTRHPKARILIAADDDWKTDGNPGVAKASAAALAVDGAWVVPIFTDATERGDKITDFNDLACREGQGAVVQQITQRLAALQWNVAQAAKAPRESQLGGEGKPAEQDLRPLESVEEMIGRYSIIYEMGDTVFDDQEHALVPLASMRNICVNRQIHRNWMESHDKQIVRTREIGFDPTESDPSVKCNLWGGFPSIAKSGACSLHLELIEYLCSHEKNADLFQYVLRWLAYPLQHVGAKMTSALLLHGPQGAGKNIIFERAMLAIYGRYGAIIGQDQLDSKFNSWQSHKLYMYCDEVMTTAELYQNKNKVKGMITSDFVTINPKGTNEYQERNHCNLVFASNDVKPLILERDDRRFTVIWTPPKLGDDYYAEIGAEMRAGGAAALHDYLLNLPLGDFSQHTKPLETQAKLDLIALGMDNVERFWVEWINKHLPLPVVTCKSEDFYNAYRWWCNQNGIGKPAQSNTLLANSAKRPGAAKMRKHYYLDQHTSTRTQATLLYPPGADQAADTKALTTHIHDFSVALDDWKGDANASPALRRVK